MPDLIVLEFAPDPLNKRMTTPCPPELFAGGSELLAELNGLRGVDRISLNDNLLTVYVTTNSGQFPNVARRIRQKMRERLGLRIGLDSRQLPQTRSIRQSSGRTRTRQRQSLLDPIA